MAPVYTRTVITDWGPAVEERAFDPVPAGKLWVLRWFALNNGDSAEQPAHLYVGIPGVQNFSIFKQVLPATSVHTQELRFAMNAGWTLYLGLQASFWTLLVTAYVFDA